MDNVDNMDTDGRRVEAIQAHRHEGQEEQTASTDEKQTAARYRQRGKRPDVWRREDRPRAVLLPVCSVCPLRRYIVRPAAYRVAGGKRPDV